LTLNNIRGDGWDEVDKGSCVCVCVAYRQNHSREDPDFSEGSLGPSDSGVGYRGHGSRKLPYPAHYSDRRKANRESASGNKDLNHLSHERRGLVDHQDLERLELSRIERNPRDLDGHRGLETRDRSRRDLADRNLRELKRRDLVETRVGGARIAVPEEGYLLDSTESGSTYDSQNMEV